MTATNTTTTPAASLASSSSGEAKTPRAEPVAMTAAPSTTTIEGTFEVGTPNAPASDVPTVPVTATPPVFGVTTGPRASSRQNRPLVLATSVALRQGREVLAGQVPEVVVAEAIAAGNIGWRRSKGHAVVRGEGWSALVRRRLSPLGTRKCWELFAVRGST